MGWPRVTVGIAASVETSRLGTSEMAALSLLSATAAFVAPAVRPALANSAVLVRAPHPVASAGIIALDGLVPAFESYADIWIPTLFGVGAPDFLYHWGHGAAMFTALLTMGGYGTYLGWQTRLGNGDDVLPLNLGKANRDMHKILMPVMTFIFLLGGQGGFVLLRGQGQPILQSPHSSTAVIGLLLLFVQGLIGKTMGDSPEGRTLHAYLGSATMLALLAHAFYGFQLGNSF